MTDDREKVFYFISTKITVRDLWYYSIVIGAGFFSGMCAMSVLGGLLQKLLF
jgi:hypothetical protein